MFVRKVWLSEGSKSDSRYFAKNMENYDGFLSPMEILLSLYEFSWQLANSGR